MKCSRVHACAWHVRACSIPAWLCVHDCACPATNLLLCVRRSFRTSSGMGDCPLDERVATSNRVFSSEFVHFISDNTPLLYMYALFVKHDLLASTGADMPCGSEHSSDAGARSVSQPHPRKRRTRSTGDNSELLKAFKAHHTRSVHIVQSEAQQRLQHFSAERMKLAVVRERAELSLAVETELQGVLRSMQSYAAMGKPVPSLYLEKQARLEAQLASLERDFRAEPQPPEPVLDTTTNAPDIEQQHSSNTMHLSEGSADAQDEADTELEAANSYA